MASDPAAQALLGLASQDRQVLLGLVRRTVHDPVIAEDILQDALIRALQALSTLRDQDAAAAWFKRVLHSAVIDHLRRVGVEKRRLEDLRNQLPQEAIFEKTFKGPCRCFYRLLAGLRPEYADILSLVEIEGMAVKDYAQLKGISSGAAAVRVFRARKALRERIAKTCGKKSPRCAECACHNFESADLRQLREQASTIESTSSAECASQTASSSERSAPKSQMDSAGLGGSDLGEGDLRVGSCKAQKSTAQRCKAQL